MSKFRGLNYWRILLMAGVLGITLWIAESLSHVLILHDGTFLEQMIRPQLHELWMRVLVLVAFFAYGIYTQLYTAARDQADQAVRAGSEIVSVLNAAFEGIILHDGLVVLDINNAAAHIFGYSRAEMIGRSVNSLFEAGLPKSRERRSHANHRRHSRITGIRRDGTAIDIEFVGKSHLYKGENAYLLSVRDISEHVQAERDLRQSEELFRCSFEGAATGMVLAELDGSLVKVNPAFVEMMGYSESELLKMKTVDIHHPDERELVAEARQSVLDGNSSRITVDRRFIKKSGEVLWVSIGASLIRDDKGDPILTLAQVSDISDRKRSEEALILSENRFRGAFEKAAIGMDIVDPEGVITGVNQAFCEMIGYGESELLGRNIAEFSDPGDMALNMEFRRKLFAGEIDKFHMEKRYFHKSGEIVWAILSVSLIRDHQGQPVHVIGQMQDITNTKLYQAEAQTSREKLEKISLSAHDAIVMMDDSGKISFWNRSAESIFGYSEEEAIGMDLHDLIGPNKSTLEIQNSLSRFATDGSGESIGQTLEAMAVSKNGDLLPIELSISAVKLKGRWNAIGLARDITERKAAEQQKLREQELSDCLNRINETILSTLDFKEVIQKVIDEASKAISAGQGTVYLRDGGAWKIKCIYGAPDVMMPGAEMTGIDMPLERFLTNSARPVLLEHNGETGGSRLMMPLVIRDEVAGALSFYSETGPTDFSNAEIDFVVKLASSLSMAIQNTRLYAAERDIADTLQEVALAIPDSIDGVVYDGLYRSATETARVGGDFYDIFEIHGDKIGIVIGDVSGKGLDAASSTYFMKNTIKAYAFEQIPACKVLARVNDAISKIKTKSQFVTVFFGILDKATGGLNYASAGHPPAIIRRANGRVVALEASCPAIGIVRGIDYAGHHTMLNSMDSLFLYTDGVTEARSGNEFYGSRRLSDLVAEIGCSSPKDLVTRTYDEINEFTSGSLRDDVALFVVTPTAGLGGNVKVEVADAVDREAQVGILD